MQAATRSSVGPLTFDRNEWKLCRRFDDVESLQYDIDSVVLYGHRSFSWIKPKIQFTCDLNTCGAIHWDDKKVKEQLSTATKTTTYPGYRWVSFRFGGFNVDSINVIVVVKTDEQLIDPENDSQEPVLRNYRKRFFENYVYEALRIAESQYNHQTHTRMANSMPDLPSNSKLIIYPEIWAAFCDNIDKLLAQRLPKHTDAIFLDLHAHGIKSDAANRLITVHDRITAMVHQEHPGLVLAQLHMAVNLQNEQQIIIADLQCLRNCFPMAGNCCNRYKYFLFDNLGAFTSHRHRITANPNSVSKEIRHLLQLATYVQFYPENVHILMKGAHGGKNSYFANAVFGDVGNVIPETNPDKLSKELRTHANNLKAKISIEQNFIDSCSRGVAARFEVVFTFLNHDVCLFFQHTKELANHSTSGEPVVDSTLHKSLNHMLAQLMENEIILISSGEWWTSQHLAWYKTSVFRPLIFHTVNFDLEDNRKPMTIANFRYIYDLQVVSSAFLMGSWNPHVDAKRLKHLRSTRYHLTPPDDADAGSSHSAEDYQNWYDPRLMSRCGYSCAIVNHVGTVLREAAVGAAQQRQRSENPFVTLYSLISSYCTVAWHLGGVGRPATGQSAPLSVFSKQTFNRGCRRQRHKLRLAEAYCTSFSVYESILDPVTAIGQILLAQVFNHRSLHTLKADPQFKHNALSIIKQNVHYFPSFMLNPRYTTTNMRRDWRYWCTVDDSQIIGAGHTRAERHSVQLLLNNRFHPYRVPEARPKYDRRLNLKQYQTKN